MNQTGFATPSETFAFVDIQNIADGVANPVRQKVPFVIKELCNEK